MSPARSPLVLLSLCAAAALASCAERAPQESRSQTDIQNAGPPPIGELDDGVYRTAAPGPVADAAEEIAMLGDRIFFARNSAAIDAPSADELVRIVSWFNANCAGGSLTLDGHTDATGERNRNLDLSRRRALAVARFVVAHDIRAARVDAVGHGWFEPAVIAGHKGGKRLAYAENRRVVIVPKDCVRR